MVLRLFCSSLINQSWHHPWSWSTLVVAFRVKMFIDHERTSETTVSSHYAMTCIFGVFSWLITAHWHDKYETWPLTNTWHYFLCNHVTPLISPVGLLLLHHTLHDRVRWRSSGHGLRELPGAGAAAARLNLCPVRHGHLVDVLQSDAGRDPLQGQVDWPETRHFRQRCGWLGSTWRNIRGK